MTFAQLLLLFDGIKIKSKCIKFRPAPFEHLQVFEEIAYQNGLKKLRNEAKTRLFSTFYIENNC